MSGYFPFLHFSRDPVSCDEAIRYLYGDTEVRAVLVFLKYAFSMKGL